MVYMLFILSIYHVYVDLRHIPVCLAPSHVKHKNDQFSILYGVYTLSMPVLSLTYTHDTQYIYISYTKHINSI